MLTKIISKTLKVSIWAITLLFICGRKSKSSPLLTDSVFSTSLASFPIQTNTCNGEQSVSVTVFSVSGAWHWLNCVPGPRHPTASRHLQRGPPVWTLLELLQSAPRVTEVRMYCSALLQHSCTVQASTVMPPLLLATSVKFPPLHALFLMLSLAIALRPLRHFCWVSDVVFVDGVTSPVFYTQCCNFAHFSSWT